MNEPEIGAPAPEFSLPTDGGQNVALADLRGRKVVLYFYPKDDTPGCTKEAIAFTEHRDAFEASGATILGLSKDTVAKHAKFVTKHNLGIPLLSDESGDVVESYGSWVEKAMYGKTYMGIDRSTFLIDETGVLRQVWRKVKVKGHVEEVLAAVQSL